MRGKKGRKGLTIKQPILSDVTEAWLGVDSGHESTEPVRHAG